MTIKRLDNQRLSTSVVRLRVCFRSVFKSWSSAGSRRNFVSKHRLWFGAKSTLLDDYSCSTSQDSWTMISIDSSSLLSEAAPNQTLAEHASKPLCVRPFVSHEVYRPPYQAQSIFDFTSLPSNCSSAALDPFSSLSNPSVDSGCLASSVESEEYPVTLDFW
jgi:hypothetical protein